MAIKSAARIIAEELCAKFPDAPNLQLARRLRNEYPESFANIDNARSIVRVIRGAIGKAAKHYATQPRKKGKAGQKVKMPPSMEEPWEPFTLDGAKRVGCISDTHIPYHSDVALEAAVRHLKASKIDTLLINGDFADFYQVSRHQRDPKKRRFSAELQAVRQGLQWLRQEFPKARIVYKLGNHEERWNHFIWNRAPEIYDINGVQTYELLEMEKHGVEEVRDQRIVLAGKLPILHGHEFGKSGIAAPVNPARGAFLRTHHTVLVGHSHITSAHAESNMWKSETFVWSQGCLCTMRPEWARFAKWNWGFSMIDVANDGAFDVQNLRIARNGEIRKS